jgi:hypothetical protein
MHREKNSLLLALIIHRDGHQKAVPRIEYAVFEFKVQSSMFKVRKRIESVEPGTSNFEHP